MQEGESTRWVDVVEIGRHVKVCTIKFWGETTPMFCPQTSRSVLNLTILGLLSATWPYISTLSTSWLVQVLKGLIILLWLLSNQFLTKRSSLSSSSFSAIFDLCWIRAGVDPDIELVAGVKPPFGKWDALMSRYVSNSNISLVSHVFYLQTE